MSPENQYGLKLEDNCAMQGAIHWTWSVFNSYCNNGLTGEYSAGYSNDSQIKISESFWNSIAKNKFSTDLLNDKLIEKEGDLLATAFYFLNCLWEREEGRVRDHWGRSEFGNSIWSDYGYERPFVHVNNVFDELASKLGVQVNKRPSSLFLSHDIDAVYSAWLEDGKAALRKGKIGSFAKGVSDKLAGRSSWLNFSEILELEKEYDYTSTFFWINAIGKVDGVGKNADYDIKSSEFVEILRGLAENGSSHGIHRSIAETSLKQEVQSFPVEIESNRYHYLRFHFPELIDEMNDSGLKVDASLGYAEVIGYRNGYSLPFIPYDLKNNRPSNFVEVPLCIMDATLSRYQKIAPDEAVEIIKEFMNEHSSQAVISILWHNTHFTNLKYEGFPDVYRKALEYGNQLGLKSISPTELIELYSDVHE